MGEHHWGEGRERDGAQACERPGCMVRRIRHSLRRVVWQRRPRSQWTLTTDAPIPPCAGAPSDARCAHIERIPMALGPEHTVRGGTKVGQCERAALPRMVVCAHHATPDAVRLVILGMAADIERLMASG